MKSYGYTDIQVHHIENKKVRARVLRKLHKVQSKNQQVDKAHATDVVFSKLIGRYGVLEIFGDEEFAPLAYHIWNTMKISDKTNISVSENSTRMVPWMNTRLEKNHVVIYLENSPFESTNLLEITFTQLHYLQASYSSGGSEILFRYGKGWKEEEHAFFSGTLEQWGIDFAEDESQTNMVELFTSFDEMVRFMEHWNLEIVQSVATTRPTA